MIKRSKIHALLLPCAVIGAFAASVSAQETPSPRTYDSFPKWSEFPPPPQNVPTPEQIRQQVVALKAKSDQLQKTADALPWELKAPEAMAKAANARIDPVLGAPIKTGADSAAIESLAARLRARAEPPPVAK